MSNEVLLISSIHGCRVAYKVSVVRIDGIINLRFAFDDDASQRSQRCLLRFIIQQTFELCGALVSVVLTCLCRDCSYGISQTLEIFSRHLYIIYCIPGALS